MKKQQNMRLLIIIFTFIGVFGFVGWAAWQSRTPSALATKKPEKCTGTLAQSLATRDQLQSIRSCIAETFVTNTQEEIEVIEINYGSGQAYRGKFYFLNDQGRVITSFDNTFATPDLSLGSKKPACQYVWTNDIRAITYADPKHIKRSLIKNADEYRWELKLTRFSGRPSSDSTPVDCLRTGTLTTRLDGTDVKIIGSPQIDIK